MSDRLISIFSEILEIPEEKLNDETSPKNTSQWDSLSAMLMVAAIETKFNVHLNTKEISEMNSIGGARQVLRDKNVDV